MFLLSCPRELWFYRIESVHAPGAYRGDCGAQGNYKKRHSVFVGHCTGSHKYRIIFCRSIIVKALSRRRLYSFGRQAVRTVSRLRFSLIRSRFASNSSSQLGYFSFAQGDIVSFTTYYKCCYQFRLRRLMKFWRYDQFLISYKRIYIV